MSSVSLFLCVSFFAVVGHGNGAALRIDMKHRGFVGISQSPLASAQMLQVSANRSALRFHHLRRSHAKRAQQRGGISVPLRAGSDYIMPLMIGSPPQKLEVFMDTGSDLVWVPCSANSSVSTFECIMCDEKSSEIPTFKALESKSVRREHCSSQGCSAIHNSNNSYDICTMAGCPFDTLEMYPCKRRCPPFFYAYGDGSLRGHLINDKLTVQSGTLNFTFGCAGITLGESIGVAGFGKGYLSVPSQLTETGSKSFSYCLVSHKFDDNMHVSSPLVVGSSAIPEQGKNKVEYTEMINNPKYPTFYYMGIEGISIGGHKLSLPATLKGFDENGNGGFIIDTGTTFTMLPASVHRQLLQRLKIEVQYKRSADFEESLGLDLCYNFTSADDSLQLPSMRFHFGNNASIDIPPENYLFMMSADAEEKKSDGSVVGCVIIMNSGSEVYGPAAVLGNFQQQNMQIVYDMENHRIGFQRRKCSPL